MRTFLAPVFLLAVSLQFASADWVIVQKSTTDGKSEETTTKVKGDKARTDVGGNVSMLLDSGSGSVTMLMHPQKAMMQMDGDALKGMLSMAAGALGGGNNQPAAKPAPTGEKEKIGSYDTEIYTWSGPLGTGKFWVAKDFPNWRELGAMQDKIMKAMGGAMASLAPPSSDFPGMIVKSEMKVMGKTVISEVVSAKEEPVADDVFALPTDYQKMEMPKLPGAGK